MTQKDPFNPTAPNQRQGSHHIPSLVNGKQVPYTGPKPQCTGTLKDNKDHTR